MTKAEKLDLLQEIVRLEGELAAKKARLALRKPRGAADSRKKLSIAESRREFDRLIQEIGKRSSGGNSVEDQRRERERCK